ncbi:MAG: DUF4832 domain-containing protein [Fimbriimonas sp.]
MSLTTIIAATLAGGFAPVAQNLPAGPGPLDNPLKGYASYAGEGETLSFPSPTIYVDASWAQLEPQEGKYDFAGWERKEWETPLAKGKHIVFRVYLDYPNQPVGVPQWLIDKGVKMTPYEQFGGGKSPDYEDPRLQESLLKLIAALGKRYDGNPRVAFVQVGLLGHWGEFHTYPREELFPKEATQIRFVEALRKAFPHKHLMGRNPSYKSLKIPTLGFHDDMIPEDTLGPEDWKFLPGLKANGLDGNWKVAPTGGEMVPGAAQKWLGEGWETTKQAVRDTHFSWIGPYCPAMVKNPSPQFKERAEALIRMLGYEYRLTRLTASQRESRGTPVKATVEGVNQGVAPFYYAWPVEFALVDAKGKVARRAPVDVDIRKWLPGKFRFTGNVPTNVRPGRYWLGLGIVDPWKKRPAIGFANGLPKMGGYTVMGTVDVTG